MIYLDFMLLKVLNMSYLVGIQHMLVFPTTLRWMSNLTCICNKILRLGIEPRTSAVLRPRHNQLDHPSKWFQMAILSTLFVIIYIFSFHNTCTTICANHFLLSIWNKTLSNDILSFLSLCCYFGCTGHCVPCQDRSSRIQNLPTDNLQQLKLIVELIFCKNKDTQMKNLCHVTPTENQDLPTYSTLFLQNYIPRGLETSIKRPSVTEPLLHLSISHIKKLESMYVECKYTRYGP